MKPFIDSADYLNVDPNMDVDFFIEGKFSNLPRQNWSILHIMPDKYANEVSYYIYLNWSYLSTLCL